MLLWSFAGVVKQVDIDEFVCAPKSIGNLLKESGIENTVPHRVAEEGNCHAITPAS